MNDGTQSPPVSQSCLRHSNTWGLLGVCGSGVRAFCQMLLESGQIVVATDSDSAGLRALSEQPHPRMKFEPWGECCLSSLPPGSHVVHSVAIPTEHPILQAARVSGHIVSSLPEAMAVCLHGLRQICVAGTHGKTTTSGMIWWGLQQAGLAPAGVVGGEFCGGTVSGSWGAGRLAVVESCEYRHSFLHLNPTSTILTGIEPDHFDCFAAARNADDAYEQFLAKIPVDGHLIFNADSERAMRVAEAVNCSVQTFGRHDDAAWQAVEIRSVSRRNAGTGRAIPGCSAEQRFEVRQNGRRLTDVTLQVPGLHNVYNGLAAFAALTAEGLTPSTIAECLAAFPGMKRRFEYRGNWRAIEWIDDYAHHPSAIRSTLATARTIYRGRRILGVFEPHQGSRLRNLFGEFTKVLADFDQCLVLPVLPARESLTQAECRQMSEELVQAISEAGGRAILAANLDQVPGRLDHAAKPGDVVITMGAGRTHQIHDEIHRRLQRDSAA